MWAGGLFPTSPQCVSRRTVKASGPSRPPTTEGPTMADKSPRQAMTKKSGKSLKEKRAVKRAKADGASSTVDGVLHIKRH